MSDLGTGLTLIQGDALKVLASIEVGSIDAVITDVPYGETSLKWDRWPTGWLAAVAPLLKPTGSLWCFGSMRMFLDHAEEFREHFAFGQDLVWEKQNGSGLHNDRFRRVHECITHWVPKASKWGEVFKVPVKTNDATARTVRRKTRPAHWGAIGTDRVFTSEDGGPRLMRSVIAMRNCHGRAIHPTQKPEDIVEPLLRYSVPPGGLVLDPFAGSGTTLAVARSLGMRCIGIEADPKHYQSACDRLRGSLPLGGAA